MNGQRFYPEIEAQKLDAVLYQQRFDQSGDKNGVLGTIHNKSQRNVGGCYELTTCYRVEDAEAARFRETTRLLGTTPADAMRIFVSAFNAHRGFPFEVRLPEPKIEAFASEQEAAEFSDRLALRMMNDAW